MVPEEIKTRTLTEILASDNFTNVKKVTILTPNDKKIYDEIVLKAKTDTDIIQMSESQLNLHILLLNLIGDMNNQLFDLEKKLISNIIGNSTFCESTLKEKLLHIKRQLFTIYSNNNLDQIPLNISIITKQLLTNIENNILRLGNILLTGKYQT